MSPKAICNRHAAAIVVLVGLTAFLSLACTSGGTNSTAANANANSNVAASGNANETATANASPGSTGALEAREPERYSVATTITVQPTGNAPQANIPPLRFVFARAGTDRRVSFKLPDPVGEVVYLEKPPLKYLVFPARNQYVELDPNELGFQLGQLMSPVSAIERLKARTHYETMGTEPVNGRMAIKYRFAGAVDTHTKAGTAQADSILYVDQETGLPLRSEIETSSSSGAGARLVISTDSLKLTADASLFDVPTTMKKVSSAELKQQVQGFVSALRVVAGYLRQQVNATAPSSVQ